MLHCQCRGRRQGQARCAHRLRVSRGGVRGGCAEHVGLVWSLAGVEERKASGDGSGLMAAVQGMGGWGQEHGEEAEAGFMVEGA